MLEHLKSSFHKHNQLYSFVILVFLAAIVSLIFMQLDDLDIESSKLTGSVYEINNSRVVTSKPDAEIGGDILIDALPDNDNIVSDNLANTDIPRDNNVNGDGEEVTADGNVNNPDLPGSDEGESTEEDNNEVVADRPDNPDLPDNACPPCDCN